MNNGLLYLGSLIALILGALFAVPHLVDWNGYRGVFEEEAARVLGRDVRVGGNVSLRLLPAPYVSFEKVRIANAGSSRGEPFFRVESFTMKLAAAPLLRGAIEAKEIELVKPVLTLAVDGEGQGNWSGFTISPRELPFVPADVAFRSVKLSEAEIALYGPRENELARIRGINGELTADALTGPFSFRGTAVWNGEEADVKLATTKAAPDGSFKLKGAANAARRNTTANVEAQVKSEGGRPKFEGVITARTTLSSDDGRLPNFAVPAGTQGDPIADLNAPFRGDGRSISLDGLKLSIEKTGEPQIVTGNAAFDWSKEPSVKLVLASQWLDLDRLIGTGLIDHSPLDRFQQLSQLIGTLIPDGTAAEINVALDQVKIAGDDVGSFRVEAQRDYGPLKFKSVEAGLPGGARLSLSGEVTGSNDATELSAKVLVRGANTAKLARWLREPDIVSQSGGGGTFFVSGDLRAGPTGVSLLDANAEFDGMPFSGNFTYKAGERPRYDVSIKSADFDTSRVIPQLGDAVLAKSLSALGAPQPSAEGSPSKFNLDSSDLSLRLQAARLQHDGWQANDVNAELEFINGAVNVTAVRFKTADGLSVAAHGAIAPKESALRGSLSWDVSGQSRGVAELIASAGLPAIVAGKLRLFKTASISGITLLAPETSNRVETSFGGLLDSAQISGKVTLDRGWVDWRSSPMNANVTIIAPQASVLARAFADGRDAGLQGADAASGNFTLSASGTPSSRLLVQSALEAGSIAFSYDGVSALGANETAVLDGALSLRSASGRDVFGLFGWKGGNALAGVPLSGKAHVSLRDGGRSAKWERLSIGGAKFTGDMSVRHIEDGVTAISADMQTDKLAITDMLAAMLAPPSGRPVAVASETPEAALAAEAAAPQNLSIWPDQAFDFASVDGVKGEVRLAVKALSLTNGLGIENALAEVTITDGKINITKLTGKAAGGDLLAEAIFARAPGGGENWLKASVAGADVSKLIPSAKGKGSFTLELAGRAQSPAGFIAAAEGSGSVETTALEIPGPAPVLVEEVANAVLAGRVPAEDAAMKTQIDANLQSSRVTIGSTKVPVEVRDGVAKINTIDANVAAGSAQLLTTVDLSALALDGAWQISLSKPGEPAPFSGPKRGPLPGMSVIYAAKLQDPAGRQVIIDIAELQRELAVRKLETSVDELERLRKIDEEQARLERERQKVIEEERARLDRERQQAIDAARDQQSQALPDPNQPPPPAPAAGQPDAVFLNPGGTSVTTGDGSAVDAQTAPTPDIVAEPPPERPSRPYSSRSQNSSRQTKSRQSPNDDILRSLGGVN